MKMILIRGLLTWLIPFIISFLFFTPEGHLLIDMTFFKSIMLVLGCLIGVILLIQSFKNIQTDSLEMGIKIGIIWLLINLILDFIFLLPLGKLTLVEYFTQIGIRYLNIPIISIGMGYLIKIVQKKLSL